MLDTSLVCPACRTPVVGSARFCMHCGTAVSGSGAASAVSLPALDLLREQLIAATAGEYQILAELGRGGMATVYLAEDLALARRVAIKVMTPGMDNGEGMAERFLLEARTAAQLSHPNIIPIYAVRTTGQLRFFVMKYVPGRSLDRVLQTEGPLPIPIVQAILVQVGSALDQAHARGVVHRDIKPANIMLDEDGSAIVADFGIAKVARGTGLTTQGATVGTPTYMSPEQCTGKPITGASDQYALGCVAFELLTGRPPFVFDEVIPLLLAHVSDPAPEVSTLRADCPADLVEVVSRMLRKDPAERWPELESAGFGSAGLAAAHDPAVRAALRALAVSGDPLALLDLPSVPLSPLPARAAPAVSRTSGPGAARTRVSAAVPAQSSGPVSSLTVEPNGVVLQAGAGLRLEGVARDRAGLPVDDAPVQWESSAPQIVAVSASGVVTALSEGVASVVARSAEARAAVQVRVSPVPVSRLRLADPGSRWEIGDRRPLQVAALDQTGSVLLGRPFRWGSSDPAVVTVGPDGVARAVGEGQARIQVRCEEQLVETLIEVHTTAGDLSILPATGSIAVGQVLRLTALWNAGGSEPRVASEVRWTSSDPEVLRISPEGELSGVRPGSARIRAVAGNGETEVTYQVTRVEVAAARILPRISAVSVGEEVRLQAIAADRLGSTLPGRVVSWQSSNPEVAVVEADGTVRGVAIGAVRISAGIGAGLATLDLKVTPVVVGGLRIEPAAVSLRAGETRLLEAVVHGPKGEVLRHVAVSWVSSDPGIVTVGPDGVVTGRRFGSARIAASAGGRRATMAVEVQPATGTSSTRGRTVG